VRETGFLRVAVRNRVFEFNQNWEANIVTKTRFLIAAGGKRNRVFSINPNWQANIVAKTRFLILGIIWPHGFP